MTLEEAMKHCEEVADFLEHEVSRYDMSDSFESYMACKDGKCAEEHRQLAKWLKKLQAYEEILANADKIIESRYGCVIIEGYADVIDQMNEVFKEVKVDGDSN